MRTRPTTTERRLSLEWEETVFLDRDARDYVWLRETWCFAACTRRRPSWSAPEGARILGVAVLKRFDPIEGVWRRIFWATEEDRLGIGAPPENAVDPSTIQRRRRARRIRHVGNEVFEGNRWRC